ncbi:Holliday junction resolvase, partial [Candidatus Pacearchaeota archaeon]|nr:Holliday junction resolvase [Candidatus Pacearchaeota archaeon]
MGNKEKGANAERELLHMLWQKGFACARVAGSGKIPEPSCDLVAGKFRKKYAIECKTSKDKKRYIDSKQISDFLIFSEIFGLEPVMAIRFNREDWLFLHPEKLEKTE